VKRLLFLLLLLALGPTCLAVPVTLVFSAQSSGGGLGDASGNELPPGCRVLAGSFDLTPAQVAAAATDQFTLFAAFRSYGSAVIGTFNGTPQNVSGGFSSRVTVDSAVAGGKRIYLWAFNAPSPGEATAHVLLSSPDWVMPGFGSLTCEVSQVPAADPAAVFIATRAAGVTSPTLGGLLNRAVPLAHPDGSDHDGDGVPALVEWATGSDPAVPGPPPLAYRDGSLSFPRRSGSSGSATDFNTDALRYVVQTSEDLGDWETFDAALIGSSSVAPGAPGIEHLRLDFPTPQGPARFWRLRVTRR
jgi:hypothetical protein